MKKTSLAIYLAGSIQKGHESPESQWTEADRDFLKQNLPQHEISFLNPAQRTDDLTDQRSVFGRDMFQVFSSDLVFVDARDKRGLGVGAEMMWAKTNSIPLLILSPKDTHYNKSKTTLLGVTVENWVHPFVESLADGIVPNLLEGARWIREVLPSLSAKNMGCVHSAMQYYLDTQFSKDAPMQELYTNNFKNRFLPTSDSRCF